jgi:thioredoxin 1
MRILLLVIATLSLAAIPARAPAMDEPPIFDKRPYADARKAARDAGKWFIVKATAVWCGPCKRMDQSTWRDAKVVAWLEKNAVVVAVDVDKEQDLARELRIQAMPTMVALKAGKDEFDRVVGYKSPEEFLAWLEGIEKGEKSIEAVKREARQPGGGDMRARLNLARALVNDGKNEEAADEYVWLWKHMLEEQPSMYGVRLSFMAGDMERLADSDQGARAKFVAVRDETFKRVQGERVAREDLTDWLTLNRILGEQDETLKWFDTVKEEPRWRSMLQGNVGIFDEPLRGAGRWADLGRLYKDPMRDLQFRHQLIAMRPPMSLPEGIPEEQRKEIEDMPGNMFRENVSRIYAALLAADREKEAEAFANEARRLDGSAKLRDALVETALEAREPREEHLGWTAEGEGRLDGDLRKRVQAALKKGR